MDLPSRRNLILALGAAGLPAVPSRPLTIIEAPSNLGLRPGPNDVEPGTWRAPQALRAAGLHDRLKPAQVVSLARRPYQRTAQPGTRIRNGQAIRAFSLELAGRVGAALAGGAFPLVLGGDCSVLLGCLAGARAGGRVGLVHVDGHSDFYHPGNYDAASRLGSAAGMDLALATGRGEATLTAWPGIEGPLVRGADVVQIGERERDDPAYPFHEIERTGMLLIDEPEFRRLGPTGAAAAAGRRLLDRAWLHIDVDVLDQAVMPAVDSPGSPGLSFEELTGLVRALRATGRIVGADVAIYDPDLDPDDRYGRALAACLAEAFG